MSEALHLGEVLLAIARSGGRHDGMVRDDSHLRTAAGPDLQAFLRALELQGRAPSTVRNYEAAGARLCTMFPAVKLAELTASHLEAVMHTFPVRSRYARTVGLRSWLAWARRTRRILANPFDEVLSPRKPPQRVISVYSDAEIARLTGLPDPDGALMLVLLDAGLRKMEAARLQVRDCDLVDGIIVVYHGKGGKDRLVPMTQRLQQRLAAWFLLDGLAPADHLWSGNHGGHGRRRATPLTSSPWHYWYQAAVEAAGVRYRNPHTTRHTFATRWLRRGGRLETLSRVMGHTSITTTADLYAHLDLTDVVRDLHIVESGR